jgi:hypothetical protein
MYVAKRSGRDRVVVAGHEPELADSRGARD